MKTINLTLSTIRNDRAEGEITVDGRETFYVRASHARDHQYPWSVKDPNHLPPIERFLTYDGARRKVEELALSEYHRLVDEECMLEVRDELDQMVEEITG